MSAAETLRAAAVALQGDADALTGRGTHDHHDGVLAAVGWLYERARTDEQADLDQPEPWNTYGQPTE